MPLTELPFASIAADVGLDEVGVLEMLREAKERRLVRQCSAIFDAAALDDAPAA